MPGDVFRHVAIVPAEPVHLGVGHGQHRPLQQLGGIVGVDDVQPAAVQGDVGIVLAQEEQVTQVGPIAVEQVKVHLAVQLKHRCQVGGVRLVHPVADARHVPGVQLHRQVEVARIAHVLVEQVVVQRLALRPAQAVARVAQHAVELPLRLRLGHQVVGNDPAVGRLVLDAHCAALDAPLKDEEHGVQELVQGGDGPVRPVFHPLDRLPVEQGGVQPGQRDQGPPLFGEGLFAAQEAAQPLGQPAEHVRQHDLDARLVDRPIVGPFVLVSQPGGDAVQRIAGQRALAVGVLEHQLGHARVGRVLGGPPQPLKERPLLVGGHLVIGQQHHVPFGDAIACRLQVAENVPVDQGRDRLLVGRTGFRAAQVLVAVDDRHGVDPFVQAIEHAGSGI